MSTTQNANTDTNASTDKAEKDTVDWQGPGPVRRALDSAYDNTFGIARKVWDNFFECVYAYKLEDYERKEAIGLVAKVPYRINAL